MQYNLILHVITYMKAYQDFTDKIPETDSYVKFVRVIDQSEYDPVNSLKLINHQLNHG
jgi:hypothetical protein